jgi:hypothetical protein
MEHYQTQDAALQSVSVRLALGLINSRLGLTKKRIDINRTVHGTFAAAKKVEAQLKGQKVSGGLNKPSQMTLNELLDRYLDSVRHVQSEVTQAGLRHFLNLYVRRFLGEIPINQINTGVVQEFLNFLMDKKNGGDNDKDI